MEVTIEEKGTFDRVVNVCVAANRVEALMDQEVKRLGETVRLSGFRPGKVPKKMLEARFRDHIVVTVTNQLFEETYSEALSSQGLRPLEQPVLDIVGKVARGNDFRYTATVQILPEINPVGYVGLECVRFVTELVDADVDAVIESIRKGQTVYEPDGERVAENGDRVRLDFEGFVDGEALEGGSAKGHLLELGSSQFIPGFEAQLVGVRAAENREVHVTFPDDYSAENLRGKAVVFKCLVHEVRRPVVPEVDDALAEKAGVTEGGLVKLREQIRERIQADIKNSSDQHFKEDILAQLLKANPMEVPSQLEQRELSVLVAQTKQRYRSQGLDPEKLGIKDEDLAKNFGSQAGDRVRLGLLFSAIAQKEAIAIDDEKVESHLARVSAAYGDQAASMYKLIKADPERMDGVRAVVLDEMIVDWIVEHGTVVEKPCTLEELMTRSA